MPDDNPALLSGRPRPQERPPLGGDLIIPALALAFSIYFLSTTNHLVWEAKANGVVIGAILITLIAVQMVRIGLRVASGRGSLRLGSIAEADSSQAKRFAIVAIVALFIATIEWLGTSLGLILMMTAIMWVLGVRKLRVLLGVALGTAAMVYLLFMTLLESRLPEGPIEQLIAFLLGAGS